MAVFDFRPGAARFFNSVFLLKTSVAEETGCGLVLDIQSSAGGWLTTTAAAAAMTKTRWESTNGRCSTCVLALQLVLGLGRVTAGLVPTCLGHTLFTPLAAVCQRSVNSRGCIKRFQVVVDLFAFTRLRQADGGDHSPFPVLSMSCLFRFSLLFFLLSFAFPSYSVKFNLPAYRWPQKKCLWNPAHDNTLVIVTANVSPGPGQHTDIEIVDSSPQKNVYLRKKGIKAETRLAVTTHSEGEVGVCFYNYLDKGQYNITRSS